MGIAPGNLLPVVDQTDFIIGAIVFSLPFKILYFELALTVLVITIPLHIFTNFTAYKLGLKGNPW